MARDRRWPPICTTYVSGGDAMSERWWFLSRGIALATLAGLAIGCNTAPGRPVAALQPSAAPAPLVTAPPRPIVLAEGDVPSLPSGPLAWIADEVTMFERPVPHRHEAAFVYAPVSP